MDQRTKSSSADVLSAQAGSCDGADVAQPSERHDRPVAAPASNQLVQPLEPNGMYALPLDIADHPISDGEYELISRRPVKRDHRGVQWERLRFKHRTTGLEVQRRSRAADAEAPLEQAQVAPVRRSTKREWVPAAKQVYAAKNTQSPRGTAMRQSTRRQQPTPHVKISTSDWPVWTLFAIIMLMVFIKSL